MIKRNLPLDKSHFITERRNIILNGIGKIIIAGVSGFLIGCVYMLYRCGKILDIKQQRIDKFQSYFEVLNFWTECEENHYDLREILLQKNINSVAIYGMGKLGRHLKYELDRKKIEVAYIVDEAEITMDIEQVKQYSLKDQLPTVDVVIVTPIYEYEKIKGNILKNNDQLRVVSLKTILSWSKK